MDTANFDQVGMGTRLEANGEQCVVVRRHGDNVQVRGLVSRVTYWTPLCDATLIRSSVIGAPIVEQLAE